MEPLQTHVIGIMEEYFSQYLVCDAVICNDISIYLGIAAVEALATRSHVLVGPWETLAWLALVSNYFYKPGINNFASDVFSNWLINVIGDIHLCPNSHLRFQLLYLLKNMVSPSDYNQITTLNSLVSVCSIVSSDYIWGDINVYTLMDLFTKFNRDILNIDEIISKVLVNDVNSRVSSFVRDVSYIHSMNPNKYSRKPEEISLKALLNTTLEIIQTDVNTNDITAHLYPILILFRTLYRSLQTPQLIDVTDVRCISGLLDEVLKYVNTGIPDIDGQEHTDVLEDTVELEEYFIELNRDSTHTSVILKALHTKCNNLIHVIDQTI